MLERKISQCEFFPASCRATSSNCFQLSPPRETSESTDKLRILSCEEDRCLVSVIETDGCIQPAKMGHKCTLITLLKGSQCKNVQEPSLRTTYTVLFGINASALCRLFNILLLTDITYKVMFEFAAQRCETKVCVSPLLQDPGEKQKERQDLLRRSRQDHPGSS